MKIVHCIFTMETGGSQVLIVDMLNELCEKHEVTLIIVNKKWNEKLLTLIDERVKIIFINRLEGSKNPLPIIKLNFLLYKLKPQIIHCHEMKMATIIKVLFSKLVYTIHDVGIPTTYHKYYHGLFAISDSVLKDVSERTTLPVRTVYNGVPDHLFNKRTDYTLDFQKPIKLLQVSRLVHEKKGQDILLHALRNAIDKSRLNLNLEFVGSGISMEYLKSLTRELNLQDNVLFLGEKDRMWLQKNLNKYHLLIQPSRYEGFGLTIVEALASGVPVLASNIDGPAEIINKCQGGFLFQTEDIESCANGILNIIQLYKENEIEDVMKKSRLSIQNYSIKSCVKNYIQEYNSLLMVNK